MTFLRMYAKGIITFGYVVLTNACQQGLISGVAGKWVVLVAGGAVTVGVVAVPNRSAD